jgi:hypothetical protein
MGAAVGGGGRGKRCSGPSCHDGLGRADPPAAVALPLLQWLPQPLPAHTPPVTRPLLPLSTPSRHPQDQQSPRDWWLPRGRLCVALCKEDGSPTNPEVPTLERPAAWCWACGR